VALLYRQPRGDRGAKLEFNIVVTTQVGHYDAATAFGKAAFGRLFSLQGRCTALNRLIDGPAFVFAFARVIRSAAAPARFGSGDRP
jgi:hypothetical protein